MKRNREKRKEKKKLLCLLQIHQNSINSPNICFIVAGSNQIGHENKEKDILKSGSLEKFIGDYSARAVTNNFISKKTTTFKPY